jgi:hypothetical protein
MAPAECLKWNVETAKCGLITRNRDVCEIRVADNAGWHGAGEGEWSVCALCRALTRHALKSIEGHNVGVILLTGTDLNSGKLETRYSSTEDILLLCYLLVHVLLLHFLG